MTTEQLVKVIKELNLNIVIGTFISIGDKERTIIRIYKEQYHIEFENNLFQKLENDMKATLFTICNEYSSTAYKERG